MKKSEIKNVQGEQTFREIAQTIYDFEDARGWLKGEEGSRSLAISLSLEASELLEHYQWHDEKIGTRAEIASELADVFIYGFGFAFANNIDVAAAIEEKLREQDKKYPTDIFQKGKKVDRNAWIKAKIAYTKRKDTL